MREMKAAEFKAKCLRVMAEIEATGEEVVITKRGKPIARLLPPRPVEPPRIGWGAGAHSFVPYDADLVSPVTDPTDWTGDEGNIFPEEAPIRSDARRDE